MKVNRLQAMLVFFPSLTLASILASYALTRIATSRELGGAVKASVKNQNAGFAEVKSDLEAIKKALGIHEPEPKGERQNTSANSTFELRR